MIACRFTITWHPLTYKRRMKARWSLTRKTKYYIDNQKETIEIRMSKKKNMLPWKDNGRRWAQQSSEAWGWMASDGRIGLDLDLWVKLLVKKKKKK